jgi:predicted phosphodiesterase
MFGDQGINDNSKKVLQMLKDERAELLIINGDFDRKNNPKAWKQMHAQILGTDFPIICVAGNHDIAKWNEYQNIIQEWEANPKLLCKGEAGVQTVCTYKGIKIVSTTPGLYADLNHTKYIEDAFIDDDSIWKICSWHKNMADMQTGQKGDETGWGVYEACRENGALITTAHEHAYARSYLLSSIKNKTVDNFNSSDMTISKGKTVVTLSGLGGISSREQLKSGYWWANTQNADTGAVAGALFCTFMVDNDPKKAECYFKDIYMGILDTFKLTLQE